MMKRIQAILQRPTVKEEFGYWKERPMLLFLLSVFPAVGGAKTVADAAALTVLTFCLICPTWILLSFVGKKMDRWLRSLTAVGCSAVMMTAFALVLYAVKPAFLPQLELYVFLLALAPMVVLLSDTEPFGYAPPRAALDAVLRCVGHGVIFMLCGIIREILAYGTFWGKSCPIFGGATIPLMAKPFGGFLTLSLLAAAAQGVMMLASFIASRREKEAQA